MQVDFYLLQPNSTVSKELLVCRIAEKAYKLGHKIFIYCSNQEETQALDELLWTYKPESFLPHNIQGEGPEPPPAIQLGYTTEPRGFNDILINMAPQHPSFYKKFLRIIEVVNHDDISKENSRKLYREYKKQGFKLKTHDINSTI
jgi:DNA polymerase-3 subunit chi